MTFILSVLKWLALFALILWGIYWAYMKFNPVFGGTPDAASMARIQQSRAFAGEMFHNLTPTTLQTSEGEPMTLWSWMNNYFLPPTGKNPTEPLPSRALDTAALKDGSLVWFGHSSVLFQTAGKRFLVDPVFYRATPLPFGGQPFRQKHPTLPPNLPPLDAVLISHDHYDHLDMRAIRELAPKVGHFYVPLGVKAHLQRWGIPDGKITEMDQLETAELGDVKLTLTWSRHFSGRTFDGRNKTLWGSWVVKSPGFSLFFNGDSGYDKHFRMIGEQFGPFDIVLMENGAYNGNWAQIHMKPEQSVQAALDVRARLVLPIHWGKYDLAFHEWREPIERFMAEYRRLMHPADGKLPTFDGQPMKVTTPLLGEVFSIGQPPQTDWWKEAK